MCAGTIPRRTLSRMTASSLISVSACLLTREGGSAQCLCIAERASVIQNPVGRDCLSRAWNLAHDGPGLPRQEGGGLVHSFLERGGDPALVLLFHAADRCGDVDGDAGRGLTEGEGHSNRGDAALALLPADCVTAAAYELKLLIEFVT